MNGTSFCCRVTLYYQVAVFFFPGKGTIARLVRIMNLSFNNGRVVRILLWNYSVLKWKDNNDLNVYVYLFAAVTFLRKNATISYTHVYQNCTLDVNPLLKRLFQGAEPLLCQTLKKREMLLNVEAKMKNETSVGIRPPKVNLLSVAEMNF